MKKAIMLLLLIIMIAPYTVKADTIIETINNTNIDPLSNTDKQYINTTIQSEKGNYAYYIVSIYEEDEQNNEIPIDIYFFNEISSLEYSLQDYLYIGYAMTGPVKQCSKGGTCITWENSVGGALMNGNSQEVYYRLYDTNYELKNTNAEIELEGFYSDNIIIEQNKNFPKLKDLYEYNSYADYDAEVNSEYTEVNLNNYEYVILTLKDYNRNSGFDTDMKVKGQIGITPVYNYGQTSKDAVTGVKVQDRCNITYEEYTNYRFYILDQDVRNNAVYIVKECESNSKFKFNKTIFNITYVTQENEEDPTVTINGNTYHVIPFEDLPSTANQNEEENYIPGQSGSVNDTGGLDGTIKGIQEKMGEIWDTFTYFTSLVNQMFSLLPQELRIILISGFAIAVILGLIKIFIN